MMLPAASRERLAALGIDVWVHRDRQVSAQHVSKPLSMGQGSVDDAGFIPRVRMASGDGDWLLVQNAPWDGRHDTLLGDIQAAVGSARCRFGQWAHSESAGVALDDLDSRGVRHVLVFGDAPAGTPERGVHVAADLSQLALSAQAKRRLWQLLAEALED